MEELNSLFMCLKKRSRKVTKSWSEKDTKAGWEIKNKKKDR